MVPVAIGGCRDLGFEIVLEKERLGRTVKTIVYTNQN
jgi:hypothetical protein